MEDEFGILTLATKKDYRKAVAMACSMRESTPDVPICIVCSKEIAGLVGHYFDHVVIEREGIKGFAHKILLDEYSPFKKTFFIDADMLVYKDIREIIEAWNVKNYAAGGRLLSGGFSTFGLDREVVLKKINKDRFSAICGAGHAYFEKPYCDEVFELGRKIMNNYTDYANPCRFADEDVMGIAMTILEIVPVNSTGIFGMPSHAKKKTFRSDVLSKTCTYIDKKYGPMEPYAIHFAAKQVPFLYASEQRRLYNKYGIKLKGLFRIALDEKFTSVVIWPLVSFLRKFRDK